MDIRYKINLHTYWHCGSGLAAGADVDALVIKDKNNLPYIPGKTIKGLLKEAVDEIEGFKNNVNGFKPTDEYIRTFGYFKDDANEMEKSEAFFSNAELDKNEANCIVANKLCNFMYNSVSQTSIGDDGTAKEHSLRKIQVVVPCTLYGTIHNVPEGMRQTLIDGMKYTKRLGLNRNRGLGRCTITFIGEEDK